MYSFVPFQRMVRTIPTSLQLQVPEIANPSANSVNPQFPKMGPGHPSLLFKVHWAARHILVAASKLSLASKLQSYRPVISVRACVCVRVRVSCMTVCSSLTLLRYIVQFPRTHCVSPRCFHVFVMTQQAPDALRHSGRHFERTIQFVAFPTANL